MDIFSSIRKRHDSLKYIPFEDQKRLNEALVASYSTYSPSDIQKQLISIPIFFHRQWILASARGYFKKIKRAQKFLRSGDMEGYRRTLELADLWLGQAEKLIETISFFSHNFSQEKIERSTVSIHHLQKGDIILSYKTEQYLKKSPLAWLVKFTSNSPVTHAMIACHNHDENPLYLVSGDKTTGLGVIDPTPDRHEIFLVLRTREDISSTQILKSIDTWRSHAESRTSGSTSQNGMGRFPEVKCQVASAIGFIYMLSVFMGRPFSMKNITQNQAGVFCSELIDVIFKESNILLTPRSEYDAVVGPIEILYSPLLKLVGFIAHSDDMLTLHTEVQKQFLNS